MKKRITAIVTSALMLSAAAMPVTEAAQPAEEITSSSSPQLQYQIADYVSCSLSTSNGMAICCSKLSGSGKTTKISATQYLERQGPNNRYIMTKVWIKTVNGSTLTMANGTYGVSDGNYRLRTVFRVFSGSKYETITKCSAVRKIRGGYIIGDDEPDDEVIRSEMEYIENNFSIFPENPEITYEKFEGMCGENVKWSIKDSVLTISGTGNMYNYSSWIPYLEYQDYDDGKNLSPFFNRNDFTSVVVEEGVTSIGNYAFQLCGAKEYSLPDGLTSIGRFAFSNSSIEKINFPDGLRSIGDDAFYYSRLRAADLPESVTKLGKTVFCECPLLERANIPENITYIPRMLFSGCRKLSEIKLPDKTKIIGIYAFSRCPLKEITIPDTVTEIQPEAFRYTNIKSVVIPKNVDVLQHDIFSGCRYLKDVTIPDTVTYIADDVFAGCVSLESIDIPDSVETFERGVFYGCTNLKKVKLPKDTVAINERFFENCTSLESIDIPENVKSIGWGAFRGCSALRSIDLPESVENIDYGAFWECEQLESIRIPNPECEINDCPETISNSCEYEKNEIVTVSAAYFAGTVYCPEESKAEAYALKQGRKTAPADHFPVISNNGSLLSFEVLTDEPSDCDGDINKDGKVNKADVSALRKALTKRTATREMDINGDGTVNVFDLVALERIIKENL